MGGIQGWQLVILLVIVLLLFAAPKLPAMARNLGQSMRIFKSEVKQMREDGTESSDGQDGSSARDRQDRGSSAVEGRIVPRDQGTGTANGTDHSGRKTGSGDQR